MNEDPWKHRSSGMKCGSCMWFVAKAVAESKAVADSSPKTPPLDGRGALGRCRRHAPTMAGFPAAFTTDWCGDHKLDETKL